MKSLELRRVIWTRELSDNSDIRREPLSTNGVPMSEALRVIKLPASKRNEAINALVLTGWEPQQGLAYVALAWINGPVWKVADIRDAQLNELEAYLKQPNWAA